jgi:hypothetical protein
MCGLCSASGLSVSAQVAELLTYNVTVAYNWRQGMPRCHHQSQEKAEEISSVKMRELLKGFFVFQG